MCSHLTAWLSGDDGRSWQGGLLLDERLGVSYPDGFESPDGTVFIIYDYLDRHLYLASFSEADVRAGRWMSPAARQWVLIDEGGHCCANRSGEKML